MGLPPDSQALPCRIRYVAREHWHVTWAFLGQTNTEIIPELEHYMTQVASRYKPIQALVQPPIWWPSASRAQALACALRPVEALCQLAESLQIALEPLALQTQLKTTKVFIPHLTLARLKPNSRKERLNLSGIALPSFPPLPWLLDHLGLYQSVLTEQEPEYTCLYKTPLG